MGVPSPDSALASLDTVRKSLLQTAPVEPPSVDTAGDCLAQLDASAFASLAYQRRAGRPLIQPRGGFARYDDQRSLEVALSAAGADILPLTVDSHTRHNDYETARVLLERSELEEKNLLNGYPLINHGYKVTRDVFRGLDKPVSLRHGTPDARLLVETALASGITEIEGGALTYTIPYNRAYPLSRALLYWQYIDRLCAILSTPQRPLHRESFGVLTATMVPPAMVVAVELCELLLAAEQGVSSFSVSFGQTGSFLQDLATADVLREAAAYYLETLGFAETDVRLVYHQWMGAFPEDPVQANALISGSAQIASMVGADKVITKTRAEALGIPTIEQNAEAVRLVAFLLSRFDTTAGLTNTELVREKARIRYQADAILEAVFALPGAQFWRSVAQAYEQGILDIPFAPHERNRNAMLTRRGVRNGIYIVDAGNVPLPPDTLAEEAEALSQRLPEEPGTGTFRTIMRDLEIMLQ